VPLETVRDLTEQLLKVPEGFEMHPRVAKIMDDRRKMAAGALPLDWGFAENLAYATLLQEGYQVRISGQDCGRGTFFHRHSVLHNQKDGSSYVPLANLYPGQPNFFVIDSILSEEAVLGFEYGYATAEPNGSGRSGKASSAISPTARRWSSTSSYLPAKPSGVGCAGW
jgi:2-oxoglutarate dehydrogenase E1 component